ncbi:hypothetical protein DXG01_006753 [Tephrocybe rancida]|nr:hypothetical protein DXG01_006753 [Tephrocybe rancida]
MELEARDTPPVRDDQYSLFVEKMHGRRVMCASADQCTESLYKTLLTYRLLDLELPRVGCTRRVVSPSSGLPTIVDRVKSSFKDLNNLSKVLQRTQKAISRQGKSVKAGPSPALTPSVSSPHNPLLNLYAMLVDNVHKSALVHTRINFSSAALHLAYLLKGNVYLPTETSKIEDFIASSSEDQGAIERIRSDYGSSTLGCSTVMHRTLFLALAVSPVMLLLPRSYDQSAGKSAILESWIQFGSVTRPPWMVAADDALWKVLLAATRGGDVVSHVGDAMTILQPYMSSSTPPWFSLVSSKPSACPPSTSRIEDVDSDSGCESSHPPLESSLPFADFTIKSGARTRKGTIMDLLAASAMNPPVALSALHIPSAYDMFPKLRFASDWFAWVKVQGKAYCRATEFYPVPEMHWAIVSTGSAHHYWHYDANGLGTFLRVDTGVKLWFIAVPKNGDFRTFMRPDVMTSFELDESNIDLWDVHVNVLFAGDFFVMRPGLLHCVVTPESSICSGGHFKAATTIPESVVGAYHHFIGSSSYTNTDHFSASHSILMRLLVYYQSELTSSAIKPHNPHIPDILTWDGFLAILYLCIYFELSSALVLWDYADNYCAFEASIKNRTRSRSLLYWIFSNHQFLLPSGTITGFEALQSIFCSFLAHHARLLIHYKRLAVAAKVDGIHKSMNLSNVTAAVSDCVRGGPAWAMFLSDNTPHTRGTFAWHNPAYIIQRISAPVDYDFPHLHGFVFGDVKTAAGLGYNILQTVIDALTTYVAEEQATSDDEGEVEESTTRRRPRKRARATAFPNEAT